MSHRPLDQLRREAKAADRAPHLKKKHMPGADVIDVLDRSMVGGAYHHEGPYDATLLARNTSYQSSPVEATRGTNAEAIRATPRENIQDSLVKHVPLQGTAVIPPGLEGHDGRPMQYEEGADLMREPDAPGGAYKRWEGVVSFPMTIPGSITNVPKKYLPEDYKGKGEPSFSVEKALKDHKGDHRRILAEDNSYEMQPQSGPSSSRQRSASGSHPGHDMNYSQFEGQVGRSNTTGRRVGEGLKRRFGSLRRSKKTSELEV
jgi:hypothetical protein